MRKACSSEIIFPPEIMGKSIANGEVIFFSLKAEHFVTPGKEQRRQD